MKTASTLILLFSILAGTGHGAAGSGSISDFIVDIADTVDLQKRLQQLEQENNSLNEKWRTNKQVIKELSDREKQVFPERDAFINGLKAEFSLIHKKAATLPVTPLSPGRLNTFAEFSQIASLPPPPQLHQAITHIHQLIADTAIRETRDTPVVQLDGSVQTQAVTYAGPFTAFSRDNFLIYHPALDKLLTAPYQPDIITRLQADDTPGSNHLTLPIDPDHGVLLTTRSRQPGLWSLVKNSGISGWLIILLGITAVTLLTVHMHKLRNKIHAANWQKAHLNTLSDQNILGRILITWHSTDQGTKDRSAIKALKVELLQLQNQHSTNKLLLFLVPVSGLLISAIDMTTVLQTLSANQSPGHLQAAGMVTPLVKFIMTLAATLVILAGYFLVSLRLQKLVLILEQQAAELFTSPVKTIQPPPYTIKKATTHVE